MKDKMGVISRDKNQINCIYANDSDFGKQLEGYLEASGKEILMINLNKTMLTPTQWQDLATDLNVGIEQFLELSKVENVDKTSTFSANDYVTILENNPEIFKGAIVMNGDKTAHITSVTEVLEYFDIDSAGIEEKSHS
ncbi:hypothetical protein ITJ86_12140 [Winogradskyella sp. F6397]|uniref:Arsenate reductase, glutaredoxin family n=1 Tax=Winogradskyella marina TaxID=2785530 RepID=A0ABS0EJK8_9FLAO|nr:hypothetical protein [Winogradskyella marina]MBF8150653.1 hypothetical protein [Winogradskyella marina]